MPSRCVWNVRVGRIIGPRFLVSQERRPINRRTTVWENPARRRRRCPPCGRSFVPMRGQRTDNGRSRSRRVSEEKSGSAVRIGGDLPGPAVNWTLSVFRRKAHRYPALHAAFTEPVFRWFQTDNKTPSYRPVSRRSARGAGMPRRSRRASTCGSYVVG